MLVVSRKTSERIWIGDEISVLIVRIGRDVVRVGIDAPPGVTIHREEVRLRIAAEQEKASRANAAEQQGPPPAA